MGFAEVVAVDFKEKKKDSLFDRCKKIMQNVLNTI